MSNVTKSLDFKANMAALVPVAVGVVAGAFMSQGAMALLEMMKLPSPLTYAGGVFMGALAIGGGLLVASSTKKSYKSCYTSSVMNAVNRYANSLPADKANAVKKKAASRDPAVLDGLMKTAGFAAGFGALLGAANSAGVARGPSTMKDIDGMSYSGHGGMGSMHSGSGMSDDGDHFGTMSHDMFKPAVNIDGTPMVGDVDINGNVFGVTNDHNSFDSMGHDSLGSMGNDNHF